MILYEIIAYLLAGVCIVGGLITLKSAFRKLTIEDRLSGKKDPPPSGWGSKANLVYVGAGLVILGVYFVLKIHSKT